MTRNDSGCQAAFSRVHALVLQIPSGRVSTYGRIGRMAGCSARVSGFAMASVSESTGVPWHRVVNSEGRITIPGPEAQALQRRLLECEGIRFDESGRVDLARHVWPD